MVPTFLAPTPGIDMQKLKQTETVSITSQSDAELPRQNGDDQLNDEGRATRAWRNGAQPLRTRVTVADLTLREIGPQVADTQNRGDPITSSPATVT